MISNPDLDEIQGIIISGYSHLPYSAYLFGVFGDQSRAKEWLTQITPQITTALWKQDPQGNAIKPPQGINIGLTSSGLSALGLTSTELKTFPQELVDGMSDPVRSRKMGDTGASGPEHWDFGGELKIDLLVIVQASSPEALLALTSEYRSRMGEFDICIARAEEGVRLPNQKEHFGFLDGISDPHIEGAPTGRTVPKESVKAGEFILGYTNEYGILPPSPALNSGAKIDDIGKNGSFMVFRKLKQDVFAFREYFRLASENPEEEEFFIAKAVGRWKSGAPLVLSPVSSNSPASNDFGYASTDAHGLRCPIGAHIRRANPRDALNNSPEDSLAVVSRHRLLRRGALYGPRLAEEASANDGEDRGILFICIVADIRRQFEFVQQSWINNPKFGGLFNDPDPILGNPKDGDEANLTIQRRPVRKRLKNLPRFVTTKGGAYLFLPSISALKSLAALQSQDSGISPEESSLDGQK